MRAPKFLLAIPSFIWYVFLFVIPVALVVVNSFGRKIANVPGKVDLGSPNFDRYHEVLSGSFKTLLKQTMFTSLLGTVLCLIISLPVAYFLAFKVGPKAKTAVLALLMVPFFANFLLRTLAWRIVLQPSGFVSNFLQSGHWFTFGQALRSSPLQILDTRSAVQIAIVYNYLPLMIFPLWVALDRVELHLREASKDLGANRVRTFLQVTLPLAGPGIVAGLILVFVPLSGDYVTAALLGGAKGNMIGAEVANQYFKAQDAASGSAIAVSLIISILLVLGVLAACFLFGSKLVKRSRSVKVVL
ncbi:MAG: ABC transporter permease subunit [Actinobacteria bacterium]|nr:ABC transporter permease subunit [Actinomycetota bacterium]